MDNVRAGRTGSHWQAARTKQRPPGLFDLNLRRFQFDLERSGFENRDNAYLAGKTFGHTPRVRTDAGSAILEIPLVDLLAVDILDLEPDQHHPAIPAIDIGNRLAGTGGQLC